MSDTIAGALAEETLEFRYAEAHFLCTELLSIGRSALDLTRLPDTALPHERVGLVLLFGICQKIESLLRLSPAPGSRCAEFVPDIATAMTISRSIADAYLSFFYNCVESVSDDERSAREWLQTLHAATACNSWSTKAGDGEAFELGYIQFLEAKLTDNKYFQDLSPKRQKHLLRGRDAMLKTQDEQIESLGEDKDDFRGFYELTSTYVHSLPASILLTDSGYLVLRGGSAIVEDELFTLSLLMSAKHLHYCLGHS